MARAASALRARSGKLLAAVPQGTPVSDTIPGIVSGTMSYSGTIEDNGTGTLVFRFTNFNDGDGFTYDGTLTMAVLAYDIFYSEITHAIMTMSPLTIRTATDHASLSGTIEVFYDISGVTSTDKYNLDGRNEATAETFRYENLIYSTTCDARFSPTFCTESMTGRIYLEGEGYVDASVASPLQIHYPGLFGFDIPDAGGPVFLAGAAQTSERITPLSISRVRMDVDIDGDTAYELSAIYSWIDLAGIVFTWEKIYGTAQDFSVAMSAQETSDGGYIAAGWSNTNSANGVDMMLIKTDAAGGLAWTKYLGGAGEDSAQSVRETSDGGFIVAGYTGSSFSTYAAVYRLDAGGNTLWSRTFTNPLWNKAYSIVPTADGGFIMAGNIESWSPSTGSVGLGLLDLYLVKLDSSGNVTWERRYGASGDDAGYSVIEAAGGGFAIAGTRGTSPVDQDVFLIRTDADGNLLWERYFGDTLTQAGYDVLQDANGHFVVSGISATFGGYVYALHKVDGAGTTVWSTTIGGTTSPTMPSSITAAGDGGYVLAGSDSFDAQMFKIDASGSLVWQKTFNWSIYLTMCTASSVERTSDGGFILGGSAWPTMEGKRFYLIKTDKDGNL